jgi:hypothetical protein
VKKLDRKSVKQTFLGHQPMKERADNKAIVRRFGRGAEYLKKLVKEWLKDREQNMPGREREHFVSNKIFLWKSMNARSQVATNGAKSAELSNQSLSFRQRKASALVVFARKIKVGTSTIGNLFYDVKENAMQKMQMVNRKKPANLVCVDMVLPSSGTTTSSPSRGSAALFVVQGNSPKGTRNSLLTTITSAVLSGRARATNAAEGFFAAIAITPLSGSKLTLSGESRLSPILGGINE